MRKMLRNVEVVGSTPIRGIFILIRHFSEMRVAVITPTWNRGDNGLLLKTMRSVQGQTHGNYVHIVVDHGSTDSTAQMVYYHFRRDPRVLYTRIDRDPEIRSSSSIANNRGIELVLNNSYFFDVEYVTFLHSDDMLPQRSLELRHNAFSENLGLRMVYGYSVICDKNMQPFCVIRGLDIKNPHRMAHKLKKRRRTSFPHHTITVSKDLLREVGFFDTGLFLPEDRDYSIRTLDCLTEGQMHRIPEPLYYYRSHPDSVTGLYAEEWADNHQYLDKKHGRTLTDAFVEEFEQGILDFLKRQYSHLPESVRDILYPFRNSVRAKLKGNEAVSLPIEPYIEAIENNAFVKEICA